MPAVCTPSPPSGPVTLWAMAYCAWNADWLVGRAVFTLAMLNDSVSSQVWCIAMPLPAMCIMSKAPITRRRSRS
jgi:hypothetical protein